MYVVLQLFGLCAGLMVGAVAYSYSPVIVWLHTRQLEFLLNDALLIPALTFSLLLILLGIFGNFRKHRYNRPVIFAVSGILAVLAGLWLSRPLGIVGFLVLFWAFLEDYNVLQQYEATDEKH